MKDEKNNNIFKTNINPIFVSKIWENNVLVPGMHSMGQVGIDDFDYPIIPKNELVIQKNKYNVHLKPNNLKHKTKIKDIY